MSAVEWLWTLGSFASVAALALVIYTDIVLVHLRHDEEALMQELEDRHEFHLSHAVEPSERDGVVWIRMPEAFADSCHNWSAPMQLRVDRRGRFLQVRPAGGQEHKKQRGR